MTDPTITCPHCRREIHLTESLAAPLLAATRQEYEDRIFEKDSEIAVREAELKRRETALAAERDTINDRIAERLQAERSTIAAEEAKKARQLLTAELDRRSQDLIDLQTALKEKDEKLAEAQKEQAEFIRKQRELDDAQRELDLTIEKRVNESLAAVRDKAKQDAEEALKFKVAERDQTISSLQKQIDELQRKAEQGSQQLQGEVLEIALEELLRRYFPFDEITPVAKGIHGGDVVQTVRDATGTEAGQILWESKRTKNWSDGWLPKLRDDQRAAKAQVAILVSIELPKEVTTFRHIDGVWVTSSPCAIPLASALRNALIEIAAAKRSVEGRNDKMELLYTYLSGQEFRHRVEGIVEAFVTLREDLEAEKRATQRMWAKREKQLERATAQTAGMYGDLSGIIGASLPSLKVLDVAHLPEESE